jgi:predicted ATPase/signal transduction histidine kinase/tRNA A-37 threonylcarbamoyl transferase component Bud32
MQQASSYMVVETLHRGGGSVLYRAIRQADRCPVIIKTLDPRRSRRDESDHLKEEYELGRTLDIASIVKPLAFTTYEGEPALVMEDFGGESLDHALGAPMEVTQFLRLALRIAAALAQLHDHEVMHKDIKPENILVNPVTQEVKITDLGIASRLPREHQTHQRARRIEGSLPFMSPEQTGRVNRAIDHRSDFYSLGVTFYEMLTGSLPFEARDPLEWIHWHIACPARSPSELEPRIPEMLSRIVLKLLAKTPEDRYQTLRGLEHDLERCLDQWRATGKIELFALGAEDIPERFQIPQRLYGRDAAVGELLAAFERVVAGATAELVLVSGPSGIGKSSVINELQKPVVRERGFFVAGKFDQYKRNVPYATLASAFGELIQQVLGESDERLSAWKEALLRALGMNARSIVEVIPQLEAIVGAQRPAKAVPSAEAERRLQVAFHSLVAAFASEHHPMVVFLDDLQWVDSASLNLIQSLLATPETRHLLVIGAYRSNELSPAHPLKAAVEQLRETGARIDELELEPLAPSDLRQLVADTLHCDATRAAPLSDLVYEKTRGNPFFFIQFLTMLYEEGLLELDHARRSWSWDLGRIRKEGFTDNVIDLLVEKLKRFPAAAREALTWAGYLGNEFNLEILATVCNGSPRAPRAPQEIEHELWPALHDGLLIRGGDGGFKFLHDRVQQAACSLLPEAERASAHLKIGRMLLLHHRGGSLGEQIFEIASHFQRAAPLLDSRHERERVAELQLLAGRRAQAAAAYRSAVTYLAAGQSLLSADAWRKRYHLAYGLFLERARSEWLSGNLEAAESQLATLREHARRGVDEAEASRLKILVHVTRGEVLEGARTALDAYAKLVGVEFPLHPATSEVRAAVERTLLELGAHPIESLLDLPLMTDARMGTAVALLSAALPLLYFTDPRLHDLICAEIVALSLRHGNSAFAPHGYVIFGSALGRLLGQWGEAARFGKLARDLIDKHGLVSVKPSVYFTCGSFIDFWVEPIDKVLPRFGEAFSSALEYGDMNHACYAAVAIVLCRLIAGEHLDIVAAEAERQLDFTARARYDATHAGIVGIARMLQVLRGEPAQHRDEAAFERELAASRIQPPWARLFYYTYKALGRVLLGDGSAAIAAARQAQAVGAAVMGQIAESEVAFASALAIAADYEAAPAATQEQYRAELAALQARFAEWQRHGRENFHARHALISAEIARLRGDELEAMRGYEKAIRSARDHGFVHTQAIAYELGARHFLARGYPLFADAYLREARACYSRWGAKSKVRQIDGHHPQLVESRPLAFTATFAARAEEIDLRSVIKASQTISREIVLEELVRTLLRVVLEHGGAQRACLVTQRDGGLTIEAEATADANGVATEILPAAQAQTATRVPLSIVQYVARSRQRVILDNAVAGARFAADVYVAAARPRSLLCLPILRQGELVALLYLENRLVSGAFTPDRLTVLELLASQAAISLEHARHLSHERADRAAAQDAERRAAFLAGASELLAESLDDMAVLNRLAQLSVRYLADWCVIDLVEDQEIHRGAGAHADASKQPLLDELARLYPPRWHSVHPSSNALRERRPLVLADSSPEELRAYCEDDEHYRLIAELGTRSVLVVPLLVRGQTIGALTLCSGTPGHYGAADLELARELANRAAIAIENARLYHTAQKAIRLRDDFLSVASHELKTPMTSLTLSVDALLDVAPPATPVAPEAMGRLLRLASAQIGRLNRLITDLLDVSRIEAGKLTLELEPFALEKLVGDVVARFSPELKQLGYEVSIVSDVAVIGRWDRSRIDQVVTNLLSNAIKFGARRPIEIKVAASGGTAVLAVIDHGIGVDTIRQSHIFERFGRAVSAEHYGGLGLGLYICRRIIEAHGGSIRVDSQPGAGATFTVELPCAGPHGTADA